MNNEFEFKIDRQPKILKIILHFLIDFRSINCLYIVSKSRDLQGKRARPAFTTKCKFCLVSVTNNDNQTLNFVLCHNFILYLKSRNLFFAISCVFVVIWIKNMNYVYVYFVVSGADEVNELPCIRVIPFILF